MQYTGLQVLAFISLLLGTAAVVASIATDFWSQTTGVLNIGSSHRGLWRSCYTENSALGLVGTTPLLKQCSNRLDIDITKAGDVNVSHKNIEVWEICCLALMCGSALLGILSLLFSPCCCNRCGGCLIFWTLLAALCAGGGVSTYAYMVKIGNSSPIQIGDLKLAETAPPNSDFMWSFWCGVAGGCAQLLATLGFAVSKGRSHSYSHTI